MLLLHSVCLQPCFQPPPHHQCDGLRIGNGLRHPYLCALVFKTGDVGAVSLFPRGGAINGHPSNQALNPLSPPLLASLGSINFFIAISAFSPGCSITISSFTPPTWWWLYGGETPSLAGHWIRLLGGTQPKSLMREAEEDSVA